jgi:pimeloyl-ACP methyl ester carboxylesterase
MAMFLLIHGAWHGGWCWQKVTPLLRAAGHEVCAPTLTGLGARAHLLSPEVTLETHVQDVVGVLEYEDCRDVVLVGHSYGGMVITAVADRAADRVAHLVYLDAFVPQDGQAVADLVGPTFSAMLEEQAHAEGEGWRVPAPPPVPERWGVTTEADVRWMRPRIGAHPLKAFQQPVRLTNPVAATLPRTFIYCTDKPARDMFAPLAEQLRAETRWRYRELATGHDAMVTAPQAIAALLLELA